MSSRNGNFPVVAKSVEVLLVDALIVGSTATAVGGARVGPAVGGAAVGGTAVGGSAVGGTGVAVAATGCGTTSGRFVRGAGGEGNRSGGASSTVHTCSYAL